VTFAGIGQSLVRILARLETLQRLSELSHEPIDFFIEFSIC
jgi:hypothetical protein